MIYSLFRVLAGVDLLDVVGECLTLDQLTSSRQRRCGFGLLLRALCSDSLSVFVQ